jgi:DNA modification methylase
MKANSSQLVGAEPSNQTLTIIQGDCLTQLKALPDQLVHTAVTSPPYWQKRSYGTSPQIWDGDRECQHEWCESVKVATKFASCGNTYDEDGGAHVGPSKVDASTVAVTSGETCHKCGAWLGELGHESSPDDYVRHLAQICREIYRVLRDDGTFWLNLGDTFIANGRRQTGRNDGHRRNKWGSFSDGRFIAKHAGGERKQLRMETALAPGNLAGIPWRTALTLQADGWILRDDIIWAKPSPMIPYVF